MTGFFVSPAKSFMDSLTTPKGSVIGKPEYGTEFYKLKHRSFNTEWIIDAKRCFKDACRFDDRLSYNGATIEELENGKIFWSVDIGVDVVEGSLNV